MIAKISQVYGMEVPDIAIPIISALAGVTGTTLIGRTLLSSLLKFVPIVGTATGGAIAATTAATRPRVLANSTLQPSKIWQNWKFGLADSPNHDAQAGWFVIYQFLKLHVLARSTRLRTFINLGKIFSSH
jgi:hypothetical protein